MGGVDGWRVLYSLGIERRFCRQAMVQWLYEAKSSMFVHRRLILRGAVTAVDINPSITIPKGILVRRVLFVVHADLGHCGIVHSLNGRQLGSKMGSTAKNYKSMDANTGTVDASTSMVFLAKAVLKNGRLHA